MTTSATTTTTTTTTTTREEPVASDKNNDDSIGSSTDASMSKDEYQELLEQVQDLSLEDACFELLDGARYGDVHVVRALLHVFRAKMDNDNNDNDDDANHASLLFVNTADDAGSTALHKACANGHAATVKVLLQHGKASFTKNTSGNTPLHWAAANGHDQVVALLLQHFDEKNGKDTIDVLEKNDFGRSALTEGFGSQSTATAKLLLEHDSASEERLLSGGKEVDVSDDEQDDVAETQDGSTKTTTTSTTAITTQLERPKKTKPSLSSVIHEFQFNNNKNNNNNKNKSNNSAPFSPLVKIRELSITDNPFGSNPIEDTTGYGIWCASLVMAQWMVSELLHPIATKGTTTSTTTTTLSSPTKRRTMVELGAGCGVPGLAWAKHYQQQQQASSTTTTPSTVLSNWNVLLTDLNPTTVENLQYNIELNDLSDCVTASTIDWDDPSTWPTTIKNDDENDESTKTTTTTTSATTPMNTTTTTTTTSNTTVSCIIGSDLIYSASIVPLLIKVIMGLFQDNDDDDDDDECVFYYVAPTTGRDGLEQFLTELPLKLVSKKMAPREYYANPLASQDEEECFLHFTDLMTHHHHHPTASPPPTPKKNDTITTNDDNDDTTGVAATAEELSSSSATNKFVLYEFRKEGQKKKNNNK